MHRGRPRRAAGNLRRCLNVYPELPPLLLVAEAPGPWAARPNARRGEIGAACTYVRHSSQGGARKFETGMRAVFDETSLASAA